MDRTDGLCDNSDLGIGDLRIDCREPHVSLHHASLHQELKHAVPDRARCMLGRASSCRENTREDLRLRCRRLFGHSRTSISSQQTITSDSKSYLSVGSRDLHPVYCESTPFGANLAPKNAQLLPANRDCCVESAQGFRFERPIANGLKSSSSLDVIGQEESSKSFKNTNYINSHLVQKVLGSQMNLIRTRKLCLVEEEPSRTNRLSADQKCYRNENPRRDVSDLSLHNKAADSGLKDFDTVSTESQKESGYQSGDSVFDCLSATGDSVDLNQPAISIPDWTKLNLAQSDRSELCDYYFVQADESMNMYFEQERLGNLSQALTFLNQAIEYFKMAATVPDASSENILRMRMKHNRAVLCQRKLLKLIGSSAKNPSRMPSHHSLERLQVPTVNPYSQKSAKFCHGNIKNAYDRCHFSSHLYENGVTGRKSNQKMDPVAYRAPSGGCSNRQLSEFCQGPP